MSNLSLSKLWLMYQYRCQSFLAIHIKKCLKTTIYNDLWSLKSKYTVYAL